jgi:hypothetical protein
MPFSCSRGRLIAVFVAFCLSGSARASAEREMELPPPPSDDTGPRSDEQRAATEMIIGASMIAVGGSLTATRNGGDHVVLTLVSLGGISAGLGSFVLTHGAARLHIARELARGVPLDVLRTNERRRGRREIGLGVGLILGGTAMGIMGGTFSIGGPNPVSWVLFGLGGASGAGGFLTMQHGIYRLYFGRSRALMNVAWAPSFHTLPRGGLVAVGGVF